MSKIYVDQLNRSICIPNVPQRIICLVPSITELIVDLGLEECLVGITKFCVHPSHLKKTKIPVGGTKDFHIKKIDALSPDLIIANKEENDKERITELEKKYAVWISDIKTIEDTTNMIRAFGEIFNIKDRSTKIIAQINTKVNQLKSISKPKKNVLYLIWQNPFMVAGKDNFINEMLGLAGYRNSVNNEQYSRYPELSLEEINQIKPEIILLSNEPYPFKEKHLVAYASLFPFAEIKLVDGEVFSWYGTRLLPSLDYLIKNNTHE